MPTREQRDSASQRDLMLVACETRHHTVIMIESTNSATATEAPRTRASKRRAAADATARWRQARREIGMPETIAIDRAISEAVVFCQRKNYALHDGSSYFVSIKRIVAVAVLILMKNGADRRMAQIAVVQRLNPRASHGRPGHVPSYHMHEDDFLPARRRKDLEWSENDLRAMKAASDPL